VGLQAPSERTAGKESMQASSEEFVEMGASPWVLYKSKPTCIFFLPLLVCSASHFSVPFDTTTCPPDHFGFDSTYLGVPPLFHSLTVLPTLFPRSPITKDFISKD
jgi:hypothetical protein